MSVPNVAVQNWTQYNFEDGDTNEVIIKQNGFNDSLALFQTSINNMIAALNDDVAFVNLARQELNADNIVHSPGSGLPNEAGNAYARDTGTGSEQIPLNSNLGVAAYRGVVGGGSGSSVMAQGFAGLGGTGEPVTDWNVTPNYNCFISGASGSLNKPPGGSVNGYQLSSSNGNFKKQFGSGINGPSTYSRVYDNGVWTGWFSEYNQKNIIGSVSQSEGVPTGAIIERGSNSDGSWVKFADGSIEACITGVSFTYLSEVILGASPNLPSAFSGAHPVFVDVYLSSAGGDYTGVSLTDIGGAVYNTGHTPTTALPTISLKKSTGAANFSTGDSVSGAILKITGRWH